MVFVLVIALTDGTVNPASPRRTRAAHSTVPCGQTHIRWGRIWAAARIKAWNYYYLFPSSLASKGGGRAWGYDTKVQGRLFGQTDGSVDRMDCFAGSSCSWANFDIRGGAWRCVWSVYSRGLGLPIDHRSVHGIYTSFGIILAVANTRTESCPFTLLFTLLFPRSPHHIPKGIHTPPSLIPLRRSLIKIILTPPDLLLKPSPRIHTAARRRRLHPTREPPRISPLHPPPHKPRPDAHALAARRRRQRLENHVSPPPPASQRTASPRMSPPRRAAPGLDPPRPCSAAVGFWGPLSLTVQHDTTTSLGLGRWRRVEGL